MTFDREKFKNLILYVCSVSEPEKLGAVKLNKVLWLADFRAFYALNNPITGARYVKRQFGPVPGGITSVLHELERERRISISTQPFHGRDKVEYRVHGPVDVTRFSDRELAIVKEAIRFVTEEHTAKSISKLSHDHIWQAAEDGEELPYSTVFAVPGQITDDDMQWARTMISEDQ